MKNKIAIFILFIIAAGMLWLVATAPTPNSGLVSNGSNQNFSLFGFNLKNIDFTLPFSKSPKDEAWAVFQEYLSYNKVRDLEGIKRVVYKIAPVCEDPKLAIDCEARMGAAYNFGNALEKSKFVNVWSDERQTILATDFWFEEDDTVIGRFRSILFFIRDENGKLLLLSFSPVKGIINSKGEASHEELEDRLIGFTKDTDNDGVADYEEECISETATGEICKKTNPEDRDTNANGLWDGIEALL